MSPTMQEVQQAQLTNSPQAWAASKENLKNAMHGDISTPEGYTKYKEALDAHNASNRALGQPEEVDTTAKMHPGVAQSSQAITERGQMSPEQIAQANMAGVDKSSQLASPETMNQQAQGLGGAVDQGMQSAIANRQNKLYGSSLNNISRIAGMNAVGQSANQKQSAMNSMASYEELKNQAANTQMVKYQNEQAQRNSLLNSILNLGGSIIGLATGGLAKPPAAGLQKPVGVGPVASGEEYAKSLGG